MPSLTFVLPHWLYWTGLLFFPLIAAWLTARQMKNRPVGRPTLPFAYLFWALAGYLGIHRFYLRSAWGFIFIPFFLGIIYCNSQTLEVRDATSRTHAALQSAQAAASQAEPADKAKAEAEVQAKQREYDEAQG